MATSRLYKLLPAFSERNNVLALLLGCMSFTSRWMRLLESQAARARQETPAPLDSETADPDLGLMYFLLGTITFSNHIHALLQATPRPQAADEGDPVAWGDLSDLLR